MKLTKVVMIAPLLVVSVMASPALAGPRGGGDGGGGGTPPPPPPPPVSAPSDANASLINLQLSETFDNNSATLTTTTDRGGIKTTVAPLAMKIVYNAATGGYTLTNGSRSQTFAPANIDPTKSTPQTTVYARSASGVTDTLTLTNPGTSGALTYQYVGSGLWKRLKVDRRSNTTTLDAFVYGVETEDADLPRSGSAWYTVDFAGSWRNGATASSLKGAGMLEAQFGSNSIYMIGRYGEYLDGTGAFVGARAFEGSGEISSTVNSFSGGMALGDNTYGSFTGRFFGPGAAEVGATWFASGISGSNDLVGSGTGTITGRQYGADAPPSPLTPSGPTITSPIWQDTRFETAGLYYDYGYRLSPYGSGLQFVYRPNDNVYELSVAGSSTFRFTSTSGSPTYPFPTSTYLTNKDDAGNTLQSLYVWGPLINGVSLTYTRHGSFIDFAGSAPIQSFFFGIPATNLPVFGSASYSTNINGTVSTSISNNYGLLGSASANFTADFAEGSIATTLNLVGVHRTTSAVVDFGSYSASAAIIRNDGPGFQGTFNTVAGAFAGAFFGPQAAEMGYVFNIDAPDFDANGYVWGRKN